MKIRLIVCAALALAVACGSKGDSNGTKPPPVDPKDTAAAAAKAAVAPLAARLQGDPALRLGRTPLVPPGEDVPTGDYATARTTATALLASHGLKAEAVIALIEKWRAAPEPMTKLAADPNAAEVANQVAAGAAAPLSAGTAPGSHDWLDVAAAVVAAAMRAAATDRPGDAAWQYLALIRLGQDLQRGARLAEAANGAAVIEIGLVGLRVIVSVATPRTLPTNQLPPLLAGCRSLESTGVPFEAIALAQTRWQEQSLLWLYAGGEAPVGLTDADRAKIEQFVTDDGGAAAMVGKLAQQRAAIAKLGADHAQAPGRVRQEFYVGERQRIWGQEHPAASPDDIGAWELTRARLAGTCLIVALELDRRTRRKLAPELAALAPKVVAEAPVDPISGRAWGYVDDGFGGRVLRSGVVSFGGKASPVEIPYRPSKQQE